MNKPRVFVSSTIYDFKDLRSALKFYLETLGFEVLLSEFNDFIKPIDENSYHACLESLKTCNYFILLIGSRIGGYFDKNTQTSITRKEYQEAYELAINGKIKLLTFVRQEIWNVKEDRKALQKYLENSEATEMEISTDDVIKITNHPSSVIRSAEAIFDFLDEIGKVSQMKEAMAGKGEFPRSNWIHSFSNFSDIINTLKIEMNFSEDIRSAVLYENLTRELLNNFRCFLQKEKSGKIRINLKLGRQARMSFKGDFHESSTYKNREITLYSMYLITRGSRHSLKYEFIEQAIREGQFMKYDFTSGEIRAGTIHKSLIALKENIQRLFSLSSNALGTEINKFIFKYSPKNMPSLKNGEDIIRISNSEMLHPISIYDDEENVFNLIYGIYMALKKKDYSFLSRLKLNPKSPLDTEGVGMEDEYIKNDEITKFIESGLQ